MFVEPNAETSIIYRKSVVYTVSSSFILASHRYNHDSAISPVGVIYTCYMYATSKSTV